MATAVLNLSDLNNELPILPSVIMLVNNQETQLIRYDNYQFGIKTFGKQAACFVCTNKGCNASISLKVKDSKIIEPFVIRSSNSEHKKDTCKKTFDYFNVKKFYQETKLLMKEKSSLKVKIYKETVHFKVFWTSLFYSCFI